MTYSQAYNHERDSLLDAALEVMHEDLPVQLHVIDEDGTSQTFVGRIEGASVGKNEVIRVSIGETTARVDPAQHWEIFVPTEHGEHGVIFDETDAVAAAADGHLVIHALRWSNGKTIGYHEAIIIGRIAADTLLVRFTLDGYQSGAFYSGIRATGKEWRDIEKFAK